MDLSYPDNIKKCIILAPHSNFLWKYCYVNKEKVCDQLVDKKERLPGEFYPMDVFQCYRLTTNEYGYLLSRNLLNRR
jgi:hypothetical protein